MNARMRGGKFSIEASLEGLSTVCCARTQGGGVTPKFGRELRKYYVIVTYIIREIVDGFVINGRCC